MAKNDQLAILRFGSIPLPSSIVSREATAYGVLGGLVLGVPVGFVGGIIGHTTTYEFPQDSASIRLR